MSRAWLTRKKGSRPEGSAEARITRQVVAVRFSPAERAQVERAAELRQVPFSVYVRGCSMRVSYDDIAGLASHESKARRLEKGVTEPALKKQARVGEGNGDRGVAAEPTSKKPGRVTMLEPSEPEPEPVYFVDGEPLPASWRKG